MLGDTVPKRLFRCYLFFIFLGTILLFISPALQHPGHMVTGYDVDDNPIVKPYHFYDALFISCSALSDTGLTTAVISDTYTFFGQFVIACLMEAGGIGIMTIIYLLWHLFMPKKKVNLDQIIIFQAERGNEKLGNAYRSLTHSVLVVIIVQATFAILMSLWLNWIPAHQQQFQNFDIHSLSYDIPGKMLDCYHNYPNALWQGTFTSISSINNGGFDIFSESNSLSAFRNDWGVIFQVMAMIEFIIGGIGFPLIFDLIEKVKYKRKGLKYQLSLFTKLGLWGFAIASVVGLIFAYSFEYSFTVNSYIGYPDIAHYVCTHKEFGEHEQFNKAWAIFFNTMATRSAGFSTVNQNVLSPGMQWTFIILMFIGGSPSSTAGGIRTTTLMIILGAIFAKVRGRKNVVMFKRTVPPDKVHDSFLVVVLSTAIVVLVAIIIYYFSSNIEIEGEGNAMLQMVYETTSAFGTVGFSMGITEDINVWGLLAIIVLMFIGYLGVSEAILSWTRKDPKGNEIQYPEEDVRIG
ncbi:MAG: hypothetical protein LBT77_01130 [Mycoplasmataceae bacterium]|nr:hypothetical protein [Mycoplasmataceae bacterium]